MANDRLGRVTAALLAGSLSLCACDDASLKIVEEPFIVFEGGPPLPIARNATYPNDFNAAVVAARAQCVNNGMDLAGFDYEMQYLKDEGPFADKRPDADELFVQEFNAVHRSQENCSAPRQVEERAILEIFDRERNFDVIVQYDCNETKFDGEIEGRVGLLDLDELDPAVVAKIPSVRPGQNIGLLVQQLRSYPEGGTAPDFGTLRANGVTEADLQEVNRARGQIKPGSTVNWRVRYEYDACSAPPLPTACGQRFCWWLQWSDSDVTNATLTHHRNRDDRQ